MLLSIRSIRPVIRTTRSSSSNSNSLKSTSTPMGVRLGYTCWYHESSLAAPVFSIAERDLNLSHLVIVGTNSSNSWPNRSCKAV